MAILMVAKLRQDAQTPGMEKEVSFNGPLPPEDGVPVAFGTLPSDGSLLLLPRSPQPARRVRRLRDVPRARDRDAAADDWLVRHQLSYRISHPMSDCARVAWTSSPGYRKRSRCSLARCRPQVYCVG